MSWSRVHRWLAILLVAPLVVWSVTGLVFHLKPGWARAYDQLTAERPLSPTTTTAIAPITTVVATIGEPIQRLALFDTALGPLYAVTTARETVLVDAGSARRRSPLGAAEARTLATDAVARSRHRSAYGEVADVVVAEDVVHVRFTGGPMVDVQRDSARIAQRGADTDRIDWLYRIHYLQWTGDPTIDRVLAVVGLVLLWAVLIPGIVLFVQRLR